MSQCISCSEHELPGPGLWQMIALSLFILCNAQTRKKLKLVRYVLLYLLHVQVDGDEQVPNPIDS